MKILKEVSDWLHFFIRDYFHDGFVLSAQIFFKFILLALAIILLDFIVRKIVEYILRYISVKQKNRWIQALIETEVHVSFIRFLPWVFADFFIEEVFWRHPKSYLILHFMIACIGGYVLIKLVDKLLKSVERYYVLTNNQYRVTAFRAIYDTMKLLGYIIVAIFLISKINQYLSDKGKDLIEW